MKGIRLYGKKYDGIVVCEPAIRTVKIPTVDLKVYGGYKSVPYTLVFPYLYFWPGSHVGMSRLPPELLIKENNPVVYPLPLPNCFQDGLVCGLYSKDILDYVNVFWNSKWGADGTYYGGTCLKLSTMKNLRTWEKLTQIDPKFILNEKTNYGTNAINIPDYYLGLMKK